jgi:DNA-binding NtrC family response regulator
MSENNAILIVDDELIILESLRIQMSKILPEDYVLEVASSGEECFQLIDELLKDKINLKLVISDFHLGDMDGTDVLRYAVSRFPEVKKVILSGESDLDMMNNFKKEYGFTAIISKPWNFKSIENIILSILNNEK